MAVLQHCEGATGDKQADSVLGLQVTHSKLTPRNTAEIGLNVVGVMNKHLQRTTTLGKWSLSKAVALDEVAALGWLAPHRKNFIVAPSPVLQAAPGSIEAIQPNGLVIGHAYSITAVKQVNSGVHVTASVFRNLWDILWSL